MKWRDEKGICTGIAGTRAGCKQRRGVRCSGPAPIQLTHFSLCRCRHGAAPGAAPVPGARRSSAAAARPRPPSAAIAARLPGRDRGALGKGCGRPGPRNGSRAQ